MWQRLRHRLRVLIRPDAAQRDIEEEMAAHLERATERLVGRGLSYNEARTAARQEFGNVGRVQDEARDARRGRSSMERFTTSLHQTARRLSREWRYSAAVVLVLAIGIGPTAAVSSAIYNVLLRPLDYEEPDRVGLLRISLGQLNRHPGLSQGEALDVRRSGAFASVEAETRLAEVSLGTEPDLVPFTQVGVTPGMFAMLGVRPIVGRLFSDEDLPPPPPPLPPPGTPAPRPPANAPPPFTTKILLDYGAWQTHFGGERSIVGRIIRLNGGQAEVIGVLPNGFRLLTGRAVPQRVDVYFPFGLTEFRNFWGNPTLVRLKPGGSFAEAQVALTAVSVSLRRAHPDIYPTELQLTVTPLLDDMTQATKPALRAAAAAVLLLFVIAFANATALVIARLRAREVDLAVHSALGAQTGTLVHGVLMESAVLAAAGAAVGSVFAVAATVGIREIIPRTVPRWDLINAGWDQVAYSAAFTLIGLLLLGVIPAFKVARGINFATLRGGAAQGGKAQGATSRLILVGAQMMFTVVLAFGCIQLARSASGLKRVDLGFDANVLTFRVPYDFRRFSTQRDSFAIARAQLYQRIRDRVRQIPGVTDVGVTTHAPLSGATMMDGYETDLSKEVSFDKSANYQGVTPGYFKALRIPILHGRDFTDDEDANTRPVIVVDEMLARMAFPGDSNVIGRMLRLGWGLPNSEIIGVVKHVRSIEVARAVRPQIYAPISPLFQGAAIVSVRSTIDPRRLTDAITAAISEVGPGRAIASVSMLSDNVSAATSTLRAVTELVTAITVSAGLLCAIGLYLVVAYVIHQHRRATAIRSALGASPRQIMWSQARASGLVALVALPAGVGLALAVAPFLESLVYGVSSHDVASVACALALAAVACVLGTYIPVRRAARANILNTLREN